MDFDLVFLIVLLLFYFLSRLGGKKQPQSQRGRTPQRRMPEPESRVEQDLEMSEALREIREALGWPGREPETTPAPAKDKTVDTPQSLAEKRPSPLEQKRPYRAKERPAARPDAVAAGRVQEEFRSYTGINAPTAPATKTLDLPPPESPGLTEARETHPLLRRLQNPQGARDAVVYAEILKPKWRRM
ncbi:MAG: hypothetical protein ACOCSK_00915 [Rhodothermales bacterium]